MSFYSAKTIKASRKERWCDECRQIIEIGSPYTSSAYIVEGDFTTSEAHTDCQVWANKVLYNDGEGRSFLCEADPEVDYERDAPCPPEVLARLSPRWQAFLSQATQKAEAPS